ncbi:MAG: hypothetical protein JNK16_00255 [Phycisphaerales bacterium]|nr:hypothetical protein [Phycisphaerales bacterium]
MHVDPSGSGADAVSTGAESAPSFVQRLFDASGFMPRWQCGDWSAELGWLHIVSDCLIFIAYACIPIWLMVFVFRRRDIALKGVVWLFVAFILSCGLTHLLDASMFYHPAYRLLGGMKAITAVVSLATVVALFRVMPTALALPGIAEAHKIAQREIERCKKAEDELVRTRDELESRGALLTGRLHRALQALTVSEIALVTWEVESGKFAWEKGLAPLFANLGHESGAPGFWPDLLGEHDATTLHAAAVAALKDNRDMLFRLPRPDSEGRMREIEIRARAEKGDRDGKFMTGSVSFRPIDP